MTYLAAGADRQVTILGVLAAVAILGGTFALAHWLMRRGKHRPGEPTRLEFNVEPSRPPPRQQLWRIHRLRQALLGLGFLSVAVLMVMSLRAIREGPWWFAVGGHVVAWSALAFHHVNRDRVYGWVYGRSPDQMGPGLMPRIRPAPKADEDR